LLVATDVDGCLLDAHSFAHRAARPALLALASRNVPLVLASSKTRAEMEPLAQELGIRSPLIVENGGALLVPRGDGRYDSIPRSAPRPALVAALAEIAREVGTLLSGFASLTRHEIQRLTGLGLEAVERAQAREHDEPFLIADASKEGAVTEAAARRGFHVTRSSRFFHLTGADKGRALRELLTMFARRGRRFLTVGLGDAANDLSLLETVHRPIVIPMSSGALDPDLGKLFDAECAPVPGPMGWNIAILSVLRGSRLPRVADGRTRDA
jgi:mannosyl-3-phosphoglycerate phosphatase